nr:MAG TPA: hypothetical protein [Caudoviricetes sp.]
MLKPEDRCPLKRAFSRNCKGVSGAVRGKYTVKV